MKFLVVLLTVFACLAAAVPTALAQSAPDVFLITIDTLRADHLGCYGYKDVETPTIDSVATDGIRFSAAFTHSPITNTSHTSILTGLLPSNHGVTDFGVPLAPNHVTWAELLKKQGYQTGAFIGAVILDASQLAPGLDRGFDFYDNFPAKTDSKDRFGRVERRAQTVVTDAESWLAQHPRDSQSAAPRFMWVHLFDPHDPYEPPAPFSEKYAKNLYDGEIAYTDSQLAHFISTLKKSGAYDKSILIIVGDHGEGLGEHGEDTHGLFLYDATLHVPLIVKLPANAHHGEVVDKLVRTTDILPTVLALTNTQTPPELNGASLVPLINKENDADRELLGETDYPLRWGWAPIKALREQDAKLIEAPKPEFYDLKSDPKEMKNLYASESRSQSDVSPARGTQAELQAEMAKWKAQLPPAEGSPSTANLPDPKDKVEVQNLLHNSMLASDDGRTADSRKYLEKAVEVDPTSATALRQLGELELVEKDYAKAGAHLKRSIELQPNDANAAYEAGQALEQSGDYAGARIALEASLKLNAGQMPARLLLGQVYLKLKDAKAADDQFEAALLVDSDNVEGRLGLAEAQIMKGDFAAARPDLEALTKSDPNNSQAWKLLAMVYKGLHREADAAKAEAKASASKK
ncbi:MAG TPA: sulfatase-like hydrolase/transferase [Terriglobales bacterium]|nr:sulfatase-like hydrolase/transferase [Terriglobales bacterium]